MKLFFTLLFTSLVFTSHAQRPTNGSVTIFSEDGDKFTLILNGEVINDTPQTNLRVEDLNQPYYSAKIKFENQTLSEVSTNNLMVTDFDRNFSDVTYKIKRDRNNKTKMKMNFFSTVPANPSYIPGSNVQVVHYGQPREVIVVRENVPIRGGVTQTTTTTQTNGNNVGVGINIGGINMGVSINDNTGGGTVTQTTTTTTTGNSGQVVIPVQQGEIYQNNSSGCGRRASMNSNDFNSALIAIKKQNFDDSAMKTARQVVSVNCLNVDQIIQIANVFRFEDNKLEFAKYAYDYCIEPRNYFKLNGIFTFSSNSDELSDYVQGKQ